MQSNLVVKGTHEISVVEGSGGVKASHHLGWSPHAYSEVPVKVKVNKITRESSCQSVLHIEGPSKC